MNKRSFILVLTFTVILFFVNQYFSSKRQNEYALKQQEKQASSQTTSEEKISSIQKANEKELPLTYLYEDLQGKNRLSFAAITASGCYLTLNWTADMPKQLFAQKENIFIPIHLIESESKERSYSFYASSNKPEIISTYMPQIGVKTLQIVSFGKSGIQITPAQLEGGKLQLIRESISSNGIAFYQGNHGYLPVGFYEEKTKSFNSFGEIEALADFLVYPTETLLPDGTPQETFYVLENETMQIVFSNQGGAIAEINLPFKKNSPQSVVLPIHFDRVIKRYYPSNDLFPSRNSYVAGKNRSDLILISPKKGGYYPLLRRGIAKGSQFPPHVPSSQYYTFNTLSENLDTGKMMYTLNHFDKEKIEFSATWENRRITKTYQFPKKGEKAPYCLFATLKVEGDSKGLWVNSGVPEVELISGNTTPNIKYSTVQNQKHVVEKLSLPKTSTTLSAFQPDWVSNSNGYFSIIMDPLSEIKPGFQVNKILGPMNPSRIVMIDSQYDLYPVDKYPGYQVLMPLPQTSQPLTFRLFMGPLQHTVLKQVDQTYTNQVTGYNPHYIQTQSFHGWFSFISEPFGKFLFLIMNFFYQITHSWGFSIILLTIVLRVMMYPLNAWSIKSTLKLQEVSPKVQKLQEKYKKDPKRAQLEMMQLYKQHKVNPFGGCLPLIIQMPFLIGMFDLLKSTFSLRGASFIPGWIDNLTAPDIIFSWSYPIPFIGTEFHLLPILLGVVMFFQQKFMSQNKNKEMMTSQQKQQQKMGSVMTIVFTVLFYKFPSGLNLYWFSSMLLQILQQWYSSRRMHLKKLKNSKEIAVTPTKVK